MVRRIWTVVSLPLVVVVVVTVVSALLLGIGTLLALFFAVSVWEATIVAIAVTGCATYWLVHGLGPSYPIDDFVLEPLGDDEPPISVTSAPFRPGRSRRKRRR